MNIALPIDGILAELSKLSNSNKRWLADKLYEQVEKENGVRDQDTQLFLDKLMSMPSHYEMTADEHMEMIRSTRQSGVTRNVDIAL